MEEVNRQFNPFWTKLEKLEKTLLGLWNDTPGSPESYLQRARREDEEWKKDLSKSVKDLTETNIRKTAESEGVTKWLKKWIPVIALLATIAGLIIGYTSGRKVSTLEIPTWFQQKIVDGPMPKVYAESVEPPPTDAKSDVRY